MIRTVANRDDVAAEPASAGDPCPTCGSPIRLTTYKRGPRAGKPLFVCSDYSCRTFIDMDEGGVEVHSPVAGESAQAQFERERARQRTHLRTVFPIVCGLGVLLAAVIYFAVDAFLDPLVAAVAALAVVIAFMLYLLRDLPETVDWKIGAEAERRVGLSLAKLEPQGFVTLYDRRLKGRYGNIDSITVGPTGVFVVETKARRGDVTIANGRLEVRGREQADVVRQVTDNAVAVQVSIAEAMNKHRLTVVPVVCIGNKKVEAGRSGGVRVVGVNELVDSISSGPVVLSGEDVQAIARDLDAALMAFDRRA